MEDTISSVALARDSGCTLNCEIDAFCAARWNCTVEEARRRRPSLRAKLWRTGSDQVLLCIDNDQLPVLPWCKVVVVADCSPCMENTPWAQETVEAVKSCVRRLSAPVLFELVTFAETVTSHGEQVIGVDSSAEDAAEAAAQHIDTHRQNSNGEPADLSNAIRTAGEAAVGGRTLVLVLSFDARHDAKVSRPHAAGSTHVYTACVTMGDSCMDVRDAAACQVRHVREPGSVSAIVTDLFNEEMTQVANAVRVEVESTSRSKPVVQNCVFPTVSRSVSNAGCFSHGSVRTLFTHQRMGAEQYLQRRLQSARDHGIVWLADRMYYRCNTVAEVHPVVDMGGVDDTVYTSRRPLYAGVQKVFLLRMRDTMFDTVRISVGGDDVLVLRGDRATPGGHMSRVAKAERWSALVQYLFTALPELDLAQVEVLAAAAPTEEEAYLLRDVHRVAHSDQPNHASVPLQCLWMVSQSD